MRRNCLGCCGTELAPSPHKHREFCASLGRAQSAVFVVVRDLHFSFILVYSLHMSGDIISTRPQHPLTNALKDKLREVSFWREGSVVEATLIRKEGRKAYFDVGQFGTGMVYGIEFNNARELLKKLQPGEKISAKIIAVDGEDGHVELSLTEADQQRLWQQAKELQEAGEVLKIKITGANAGGLMAMVGDLKAFIPTSQLSNEHYPKVDQGDRQKITEELKKFIGQEISAKIIDVNPRTKKFILSERETLAGNVKELLAQYQVGQVVDTIVSGIADFGVFVKFVDNPQIEGLIHVSELDYKLVGNPKEIVQLNDVVKVKITDIREGRVFLSLKALKTDPWEHIGEHFVEGKEVSGNVYKHNPFGAVIDLSHDIQGIIHISEFGSLDAMKSAMPLGTSHTFIIDSLKPTERRLLLKLKK